MKRVITKVGDIFEVRLDENIKKYFQYIANDRTQLNSDVIRGFKKEYPLQATPTLLEIIKDNVGFYAHCVVNAGVKRELWRKVGKIQDLGLLEHIIFKDTNDYGTKQGEEPVKISHNWHVWRINDKNFTHVGELIGENRGAFAGLVINPLGIIELLKGNKHPPHYPGYQ